MSSKLGSVDVVYTNLGYTLLHYPHPRWNFSEYASLITSAGYREMKVVIKELTCNKLTVLLNTLIVWIYKQPIRALTNFYWMESLYMCQFEILRNGYMFLIYFQTLSVTNNVSYRIMFSCDICVCDIYLCALLFSFVHENNNFL